MPLFLIAQHERPQLDAAFLGPLLCTRKQDHMSLRLPSKGHAYSSIAMCLPHIYTILRASPLRRTAGPRSTAWPPYSEHLALVRNRQATPVYGGAEKRAPDSRVCSFSSSVPSLAQATGYLPRRSVVCGRQVRIANFNVSLLYYDVILSVLVSPTGYLFLGPCAELSSAPRVAEYLWCPLSCCRRRL